MMAQAKVRLYAPHVSLVREESHDKIIVYHGSSHAVSIEVYNNDCCGTRKVVQWRQPVSTMNAQMEVDDRMVVITMSDDHGVVIVASSRRECEYDDSTLNLYHVDIGDAISFAFTSSSVKRIIDMSTAGQDRDIVRGQY